MDTRWGNVGIDVPFVDGRQWLRRPVPFDLTPGRIALIYATLGFLSLYGSDVLFVQVFAEPTLSQAQALKGGAEVVLTAGLIYGLTRHSRRQVYRLSDTHKRQRQELEVLHRVLRHNLRNDINVILARATQAARQARSERVRTHCEAIRDYCDKLVGYTEKAGRIRSVTGSDDELRTMDLSETVPGIVETHPAVTADVDCSVSVPETASITANPMLEDAIAELVTNAVVHNDAATPQVRVEVTNATGPAGAVVVEVSDDGPGIEASELGPLLEDREEEQLHHHTGMGLWFVDWTVRSSGGDLEVRESEAGGTTVRLVFPQAIDVDEWSVRDAFEGTGLAGLLQP